MGWVPKSLSNDQGILLLFRSRESLRLTCRSNTVSRGLESVGSGVFFRDVLRYMVRESHVTYLLTQFLLDSSTHLQDTVQ